MENPPRRGPSTAVGGQLKAVEVFNRFYSTFNNPTGGKVEKMNENSKNDGKTSKTKRERSGFSPDLSPLIC